MTSGSRFGFSLELTGPHNERDSSILVSIFLVAQRRFSSSISNVRLETVHKQKTTCTAVLVIRYSYIRGTNINIIIWLCFDPLPSHTCTYLTQ